MDRRTFIVSGAALATTGLIKPAEAFWSVVLEVIFSQGVRAVVGGVARRALAGSVARGAALTATRRVVIGNGARFFSATTLASGVLVFKSANAAQKFEHYKPDVLLVKGEPADISIKASEGFSGHVSCSLTDCENGKNEYQRGFYASIKPNSPFDFYIKDLPYTGVKDLSGKVDNPAIKPFGTRLMVINHDELTAQ